MANLPFYSFSSPWTSLSVRNLCDLMSDLLSDALGFSWCSTGAKVGWSAFEDLQGILGVGHITCRAVMMSQNGERNFWNFRNGTKNQQFTEAFYLYS